jgi:hypothetical protein
MTNWIFLSNNGRDEYVNMFAAGSGGKVTSTENFTYNDSSEPIVLRGILKHKIMKQCWQDSRDFYYVDTGYLGNQISSNNPSGWKLYHRIVKNNLQHTEIVPRPGDRLDKLKIDIAKKKKTGSKILIAAPDEKPCKFYGIEKDQWIADTVAEIKRYTDRPIEIRDRAKSRLDRVIHNTLKQALDVDVHVLVTYNSVAATEAVLYGVPAITLAPANAAQPVCSQTLSNIDTPYYPDHDKLYSWACHLAYGQYHISELKNGQAYRMLLDA